MKIDHVVKSDKGEFVAIIAGEEAGKITYVQSSPELIIIDHTEVNDAFRGHSVGKNIVKEIVEYARIKSVKILPLCPFVKSVFDKDLTISDVRKV